MPSTHASLHYHLIFSTKERIPLITKELRPRLHAYLGGIVKGLGGTPLAIGGIEDHVHLLVGSKTSHRLDYFVRDLKADSSEWIHVLRILTQSNGTFLVRRSIISGSLFSRNTSKFCVRVILNMTSDICGEFWRIFDARTHSFFGTRGFTSGYLLEAAPRRRDLWTARVKCFL